MNNLFITGSARSGTTLLGEVLDAHPALKVFSQPFPLLFIKSKERFHQSIGYTGEWMPLANYGTCSDYSPDDVSHFLNKNIIDGTCLEEVLQNSNHYSGTKTHIPIDIDSIQKGVLQSIFTQIMDQAAHSPKYAYVGSKEILCEEFIPHFINAGIKCICIIRDPRDVITSMNHGGGQSFTGDLRPTLFNIHNWRKSVHYCISLKNHPDFMFLKYEDLVSNTQSELRRMEQFMGIDSFPDLEKKHETVWSSNSSFDTYSTISSSSVGRHKTLLPLAVKDYIEATCYAELKHLEYSSSIPPDPELMLGIVDKFTETYGLKRNYPRIDYSLQPENRAIERGRIKYLFEEQGASEPIFIFPQVAKQLKVTLANSEK